MLLSTFATQQPLQRVPDLEEYLARLDAEGKVISAWVLPRADPDQYLTVETGAVATWAAAYGAQKTDLSEATNRPAWDATLFNNKGGVVFDGTNDILSGTGNIANWPDATSDFYLLAGARQDLDSGTAGNRVAFGYGGTTNNRYVGRTSSNLPRLAATTTSLNGTSTFAGAHTVGGHFDIGGTTSIYFDGKREGGVTTTTAALTLTRVRMGAIADNTPVFFWSGAIVAAAALYPTTTVQEFQALAAAMQARMT